MEHNELRKVIRETIKQIDKSNMVVQAGTELYHGTGEDFDKKDAQPGSYDNIFWTTDSSLVSQTYIPTSGGKYFTSSESIVRPNPDPQFQKIQKQFGIDYDYSQVEWGPGKKATSYYPAPVFEELNNTYWTTFRKYVEFDKQLKEMSKKLQDFRYEATDEELAKLEELEKQTEELKKLSFAQDPQNLMNQYVNNKLMELGYEPESKSSSHNNWSWKLKIDKGELKPADYRSPGRLFIIVPKRDLKIYDTTMAGEREGDLTDVDYHKHSWFEMAYNSGYDGIQINDFAQSNDQGNFGHRSIGLFKHALKDVEIHEIPAVHQDIGNEYREKDKWHSPEYLQYKGLNEALLKRVYNRLLKESREDDFNQQLKSELAQAAQKVYDEWEQDEQGYDEMLGEGGICQDIANAMCDVLSNHNIECTTYSQEIGEQHVFVVAKTENGIYSVDIPPGYYETGGGYNWKKIPDVEFDYRYIHINKLSSDYNDENFSDLFSESDNKNIVSEAIITPPDIPGTMNFWHGGNLDQYDDLIAQKNGRYEFGPGLYLSQRYDIAAKYAKGNRKLYIVTVEQGVDLEDALISIDKVQSFMNKYIKTGLRKEFWQRMQRFIVDDKIKAYGFSNTVLNMKAVKSTDSIVWRQFLINNGIDYEIIDGHFGFHEKMMVLYNMDKIVNVIRIHGGDKLSTYELK